MKKQDNRHPVIVEGVSVSIHKDDDRSFDKALRTFKKKVQESGLIKECRDRMYFEPHSEKRRKGKKMARKRTLKRLEQENIKRTPLY